MFRPQPLPSTLFFASMVLSLPLLLLSAAAIARASPTPLSGLTLRALAVPGTSPVCTLDGLDKFLVLPSNQMDVQPPAAESQLVQILMGRGVQVRITLLARSCPDPWTSC